MEDSKNIAIIVTKISGTDFKKEEYVTIYFTNKKN